MGDFWRPDRTTPPARSLRAPASLWNAAHARTQPVHIYDAAGTEVRVMAPAEFPRRDERCPLHEVVRCPACNDWQRAAAIRLRKGTRTPASLGPSPKVP